MAQSSYGHDRLTFAHFHHTGQHIAETNVSRHIVIICGSVSGVKIDKVGLEKHDVRRKFWH